MQHLVLGKKPCAEIDGHDESPTIIAQFEHVALVSSGTVAPSNCDSHLSYNGGNELSDLRFSRIDSEFIWQKRIKDLDLEPMTVVDSPLALFVP